MLRYSKASLVRAGAAAVVAAGLAAPAAPAAHAAEGVDIPTQSWSFQGPFGTFDRAQLQRGYKVYREVCASCHSMNLLSFRNLSEPGGPEFSPEQVRSLAAEFQIQDGPDDAGDMFERAGTPSDSFPAPFANENAARASNGGAYPPDLSVIAKARAGGPDYINALLIGYEEAPADMEMRPGMSYNEYFPGHQIAMPQPFGDGQVSYPDGAPETVGQYASDVSAFLMWAAEPKLEARHSMGFKVIIYLLILAGLLYATKRRLFASVAH